VVVSPVANIHRKKKDRLQYAILVDAENVPPSCLEFIVREVLGALAADAPVRRVYGDFNKPSLTPWKQTSLKLSFLPFHAFSYVSGKGTSDSAMVIDTMELLYTNPTIDGFALVTSDSDFIRLAQRLREAGKHVVGFGSEQTPSPFYVACERFVYIENLMDSTAKMKRQRQSYGLGDHENFVNNNSNNVTIINGKHKQLSIQQPTRLIQTIIQRINVMSDASPDGWVQCGFIGQVVTAKKYGYKNLNDLLQDYPQQFELQRENGGSANWVRLKSSIGTTNMTGATNMTGTRSTPPSSSNGTAANIIITTKTKTLPSAMIQLLNQKITENCDMDGWVQCGAVGQIAKARKFGYPNLLALLRDYPQHFEVRVESDEFSYYVRCAGFNTSAADVANIATATPCDK
jgi:uncharacterized LabA/DUF88 family protein